MLVQTFAVSKDYLTFVICVMPCASSTRRQIRQISNF